MSTRQIKSIIFDMDGVLWKEDTPLIDFKRLFSLLDRQSVSYVFATNNSTKSQAEYAEKINGFGAAVSVEQIITSGTTLAAVVAEKYPQGGPVFLVGEGGLHTIFSRHGFFHQYEGAMAVAGGLNRQVTYRQLADATLLLNAGADFYFTNIDPTFPSPAGKIPGAGSILAFLEAASGRKAFTVGKPKPYMFEQSFHILNSVREDTLVVGDRLETDILGGINAGCPTALVLSGISTREDISSLQIQPTLVFSDLNELVDVMCARNWNI